MKNCNDCIKNNRKPDAVGCLSCKTAKLHNTTVTWEETMWSSWEEYRKDRDSNYVAFINRPRSLVCSGNCYEEDQNGNIVRRCALCTTKPWGLSCRLDNEYGD